MPARPEQGHRTDAPPREWCRPPCRNSGRHTGVHVAARAQGPQTPRGPDDHVWPGQQRVPSTLPRRRLPPGRPPSALVEHSLSVGVRACLRRPRRCPLSKSSRSWRVAAADPQKAAEGAAYSPPPHAHTRRPKASAVLALPPPP
eukprot:scaffold115029_cov31-Tisochrysis_lutea.AAC.9